jgi:hypothetical protein
MIVSSDVLGIVSFETLGSAIIVGLLGCSDLETWICSNKK